MKKYKFYIVILGFTVFLITGVFNVNVQYTRLNKKAIDEAVYINMLGEDVLYKKDNVLYSEINFSGNENNKLRIYFNASPFDIRFSIGNHIMYINRQAVRNIKDSVYNWVRN